MKKFFGKKRMVALSIVAVLAVAGAAIAYWSSTGTGSGSGSVGAGTNDLVISGDAPTALVPNGTSSVTGNVHNGNSTTSEKVGTISGVVSVDSGHATAGCQASDFSVAVNQPSTTVVPAGGNQAFSATVSMADTNVSQDACKGAQLTITWSSL